MILRCMGQPLQCSTLRVAVRPPRATPHIVHIIRPHFKEFVASHRSKETMRWRWHRSRIRTYIWQTCALRNALDTSDQGALDTTGNSRALAQFLRPPAPFSSGICT